MSARIKFNVKNAILGRHNFSDILAAHDTRILSGFSRLVVPRALPPNRPDCSYYKQAYVRRITLNHEGPLLPRQLENFSSKRLSSEKAVTGKRLDEVQTGPTCTPCGLPWESSYSFYYDKKSPQCPPSAPKARSDCPESSVPPCAPPKVIPTCPQKPKCYPCKQPIKSDPCAKNTQCSMKSVILNNYRFYSANPCQPIDPCNKVDPCKPKPCAPKQAECAPAPTECKPKGGSKKDCGKPKNDDPCRPRVKPNPCKPSGDGAGKTKKGPVCPGVAAGGGAAKTKKGPVCPGGGAGKTKKGPVC